MPTAALIVLALSALLVTPHPASAILTGDVTVTFSQSDPPVTATDTIVVGGTILGGDASDIGTNVLLPGEVIAISGSSFTYTIFGGGDDLGGGFFGTSFGLDAALEFSGLEVDAASLLIGVGITQTNVTDAMVALAGGVVTLELGGVRVLGLPQNPSNLGTITIDLQFEERGGPVEPVPEPATLALVAVGVVGAGLRAVRGRRSGRAGR
jgi:hypothetical protein